MISQAVELVLVPFFPHIFPWVHSAVHTLASRLLTSASSEVRAAFWLTAVERAASLLWSWPSKPLALESAAARSPSFFLTLEHTDRGRRQLSPPTGHCPKSDPVSKFWHGWSPDRLQTMWPACTVSHYLRVASSRSAWALPRSIWSLALSLAVSSRTRRASANSASYRDFRPATYREGGHKNIITKWLLWVKKFSLVEFTFGC